MLSSRGVMVVLALIVHVGAEANNFNDKLTLMSIKLFIAKLVLFQL